MAPIPHLTNEQRLENLEAAKKAREERAELKAELKAGMVHPSQAIDDPVAAKIKAIDFAAACPGIGKAGAARLLERLKIKESRRIRGLGVHQRKAFIDALCAKVR